MAAVWDLRDDAFDHPQAWRRFSAVRLMHYLADHLETVPDNAIDWESFGSLVGAAVADARSEAASNWDA